MRVRRRVDNGFNVLDPSSPELVLVDPILAGAARDNLPSYDAALPDLFECLKRRRAAEAAVPRRDLDVAETSAAIPPPTVRSPPEFPLPLVGTVERAEHAPSRRWAVVAGVALLAVALAGAGAGRMAHGGHSPGALSAPSGVQPSTPGHTVAAASDPAAASSTRRVNDKAGTVGGGAARAVSAPRATTGSTATRRPSDRHFALPTLAWKRTPRATFYRVRIFRVTAGGSSQTFLFEVWTRQRRLVPPSSWIAGGRRHSVGPGTYRWYVFPVFGATSPGGGTEGARSIAHGKVGVTR
jgi:hypothetical protein